VSYPVSRDRADPLLCLGAIQKKIFVWHTGFWGERNSGWHCDLMFIVMNLVILFTQVADSCCGNDPDLALARLSAIAYSLRKSW
jgi:hypothetical protein